MADQWDPNVAQPPRMPSADGSAVVQPFAMSPGPPPPPQPQPPSPSVQQHSLGVGAIPGAVPAQLNPSAAAAAAVAPAMQPPMPPVDMDAPEEAAVRQVEWYLGEQNLATDYFLLQRMDEGRWVSLAVIASFPKMQKLGMTNPMFLANALQKRSTLIEVDMDKLAARPKSFGTVPRTSTLILREVPKTISDQDIRDLFASKPECPPMLSLRPDVTDTWFATFEGEHSAHTALDFVKDKELHGQPIKARARKDVRSAAPASAVQPQAPVYHANGGQMRSFAVAPFYPTSDAPFPPGYGVNYPGYGPVPAGFAPGPRGYVPTAAMPAPPYGYSPYHFAQYIVPGQQPTHGLTPGMVYDHGAPPMSSYRGRGRGRGRGITREGSAPGAVASSASTTISAPTTPTGTSDRAASAPPTPNGSAFGGQLAVVSSKSNSVSSPGVRTPQRSPSPPTPSPRAPGYASNTNFLTTRVSNSGYVRSDSGNRVSMPPMSPGGSGNSYGSRKPKRGNRNSLRDPRDSREALPRPSSSSDDGNWGPPKSNRGTTAKKEVNLSALNFPPLGGTLERPQSDYKVGSGKNGHSSSDKADDEAPSSVAESQSTSLGEGDDGDAAAALSQVPLVDSGSLAGNDAPKVAEAEVSVHTQAPMSYAAILRAKPSAPSTPPPGPDEKLTATKAAAITAQKPAPPHKSTSPPPKLVSAPTGQDDANTDRNPEGPSERRDAENEEQGREPPAVVPVERASEPTNKTVSVWANKPKAVLQATPVSLRTEDTATTSRPPQVPQASKNGPVVHSGVEVKDRPSKTPQTVAPNGNGQIARTTEVVWTAKESSVEKLAGAAGELSL